MTTATRPEAESWTVSQVLAWAARDFGDRGFPSPRLDAELLLAHALGTDRVRLIVESTRNLQATELTAFRDLIVRRRKSEPIAYILGHREFYGHEIRVDSRVLIPRPDSETLVEVALRRTLERSMYGRGLDLCTGSGCIAIAFVKARPTWRFTAGDLSLGALEVARDNAQRLGASQAAHFVESDLFSSIPEEPFDLITCNPPYIPEAEIAELQPDVRDFEPRLALVGGGDGLELLRKVIAGAGAYLRPGGVLAVEVGHDQAERVAELFRGAGYAEIERQRDYGGHERVVSGLAAEPTRTA